jgi:hypothetical protein
MAKKTIETTSQQQDTKEKQNTNKVAEAPIKKNSNDWEIKDRTYFLTGNKTPLSYTLKSANIYYFDESKGHERELKYTTNQKTPFVDEFKGEARLEHITFVDGILNVPKNKQTLQKFLSLYHPQVNKAYYENKPEVNAIEDIDSIELELSAMLAAKAMDVDMAEAILRVEVGSAVTEMTSSELKRDLLVYSKKNPKLFLELAKDENVPLRNFGIRATEMDIITLTQDQRNFVWNGTDRKLLTVPFGEHPYSALAVFFKTDEGMEVYKNIEKRLN